MRLAVTKSAAIKLHSVVGVDPEDIVQDAYMRAYLGLEQYREEAKLESWFSIIVNNLCIDAIRHGKRRECPVSLDVRTETEGEEGSTRDIADTWTKSPHDQLVNRLAIEQLLEAIARLSPEQRTIVLLRCYGELSYGEIADRLGIPVGSVKSCLSRARKRLRALRRNI